MNIGQQETSGLVTGRVVDARYRVETVGVSVDTDKVDYFILKKAPLVKA